MGATPDSNVSVAPKNKFFGFSNGLKFDYAISLTVRKTAWSTKYKMNYLPIETCVNRAVYSHKLELPTFTSNIGKVTISLETDI